jgi:hypothetical protein
MTRLARSAGISGDIRCRGFDSIAPESVILLEIFG